jgi:membrane-associated protein
MNLVLAQVINGIFALLGLEPEKLLNKYGVIGLFLIVFVETGLFMFFLPGDSLLFSAGLLIATKPEVFKANIVAVVIAVIAAAILGDQVGYRIGHKAGPALFSRPKSLLFNPEHVVRAQNYFNKHGVRTIIMARFVPIVRTFAPVVAGIGKMSPKVFSAYNIVGGIVWGGGLPIAGYALGSRFKWLGKRIELLSLVIVVVSLLPVIVDVVRHRKAKAAKADRG